MGKTVAQLGQCWEGETAEQNLLSWIVGQIVTALSPEPQVLMSPCCPPGWGSWGEQKWDFLAY